MDTVNTPKEPEINQLQNQPADSFLTKIKNLSRKQKIITGLVILLLAGLLVSLFWSQKENSIDEEVVIANVGGVELTANYLNNELKFYPGTPSAEIEKAIKEKMIDDQVTLAAAKKDGLISDYPDGRSLSQEDYLKRTQVVGQLIQKINSQGNVIEGKTVMVWFYNNRFIGPGGIENSKKLAYSKIKPLYDQVKSGEITIDQAGEKIKADKSIGTIDPAWQSNALAKFKYYKNDPATFWPEFNELLWQTEPGQLTPLYLGGGILRDGKPQEELYIFSQVDFKSINPNYNNYAEWLQLKKQDTNISVDKEISLMDYLSISKIYAQDNGSNQNDSQDNNNNGDNNGSRSGAWYGKATTVTGLPLPGVTINILTGCNMPNGRTEITGSDGKYNTGVDYSLSCICNPQTFTATYNGEACMVSPSNHSRVTLMSPVSGIVVPNGDVTVEQDVVCGPPEPSPSPIPTPSPIPSPSPSPTPPPACNESCTSSSECEKSTSGCTACITNDAGTGTVCRPPVACNSGCTRDDQCAGAVKDGCTACVAGTCQKPPACNVSCTSSVYCGTAKDGCTECAPDLSGKNVCQPPFNEAMCKCDGFNALNLKNPSSSQFEFESFAKVEGTDVSRAKVESMKFQIAKSSKSNPNTGTIVASSGEIVPEIVSTTGGKVRYRTNWKVNPPAYDPNAVYRVFSTIKCTPKTASISANLDQNLLAAGSKLYSSETDRILGETVNFSSEKLVQNNLQLDTLTDSYYTSIVETDSCRFIRFEYGQY